jgi:hypothetical protein
MSGIASGTQRWLAKHPQPVTDDGSTTTPTKVVRPSQRRREPKPLTNQELAARGMAAVEAYEQRQRANGNDAA